MSEEYWKMSKMPHVTIFKSQQSYKRRITETFKDFPQSVLRLIETLLAIDPADRLTATSALISDTDKTSAPSYQIWLPKKISSLQLNLLHANHRISQNILQAKKWMQNEEMKKPDARGDNRSDRSEEQAAMVARSIEMLRPGWQRHTQQH